MTLPLTTTTTTTRRWSTTVPGTLAPSTSAVPGAVDMPSGKEIAAYKGAGPSGWYEDLAAVLATDGTGIVYGDLITDVTTGLVYRAVWVWPVVGLGLDHLRVGLTRYLTTGTYAAYRATTTDSYGDTIPNDATALWTGVAGEIREIQREVQTPATQTPSTSRVLAGRFPPLVDLKPRDRIKDLSTNLVYVVESVGALTWAAAADTGVELTRITT